MDEASRYRQEAAAMLADLAHTRITPDDLWLMSKHEDHAGHGYLGSFERCSRTDRALCRASNRLGLNAHDLFLWANSVMARHFMDGEPTRASEFEGELARWLPTLREEDEAEVAELETIWNA